MMTKSSRYCDRCSYTIVDDTLSLLRLSVIILCFSSFPLTTAWTQRPTSLSWLATRPPSSMSQDQLCTRRKMPHVKAIFFSGRIIIISRSNMLLQSPGSFDGGTIHTEGSNEQTPPPPPPLQLRRQSFYRSPSNRNRWKPRLELDELQIGQALNDAIVVEELLDGRTGPKVFVECGVGRYRRGTWKIQTAMLRLGSPNTKRSAVVKKVARLRKKDHFTVYVSKLLPHSDQLEVSLDVPSSPGPTAKPKRSSISTLPIGQTLQGTIRRVEDYGLLVDVGANRDALLHVRSIATAIGLYINKATGLRERGYVPGAPILVRVSTRQGKRVFLELDNIEQPQGKNNATQMSDTALAKAAVEFNVTSRNSFIQSPSAARTPTELANMLDEDQDLEEEGDDDYDEDKEIEDMMGLGTY